MKVYGIWYGGSSYVVPSIYNEDDIEEFDSLEDAKGTLYSRHNGCGGYTPCVTDESEIHLWRENPYETGQEYPDKIISFGPRGGIRVE